MAAQVKMKDKGFLSRDITVHDLIVNKSDVHHIFPKKYLKKQGLTRSRYNQIANYALTQSEINIAIGARAPKDYLNAVINQCNGGKSKYGGITDRDDLEKNLRTHCIPQGTEEMNEDSYDSFLEERRRLMAKKIKRYFQRL